MMTSAFYFTVKFFRYLNFCPEHFGYVEKWLDKKAKINFKIYNTTNWEKNNTIIRYTFCLIFSRSKGNQTMEFGQLTEYDIKNIFLEKSYTKYGGETSPRPFYKKLKLSLSLDQQSEYLYT